MIKAVIFDYFGVICSDEYWQFVKADKNIASEFGQLANDVNRGILTWQDFLRTVAGKTGRSLEEVTELYRTQRIHPELVAYAKELKNNYKVALLTNASYEFLQPIIEEAKLDEVFDEVVMSSQVGIIKPSPNIFELTLQKLGVQPQEAVFIDDIQRNVDGAKAAGMHAILYENFPQLQIALKTILADSNN